MSRCDGKKAYSEREARRQMRLIRQRAIDPGNLSAYRCECGSWHVGNKRSKAFHELMRGKAR